MFGCWLCYWTKVHFHWLNRGLTVYFNLYVPDLPKSTWKYLFNPSSVFKYNFKNNKQNQWGLVRKSRKYLLCCWTSLKSYKKVEELPKDDNYWDVCKEARHFSKPQHTCRCAFCDQPLSRICHCNMEDPESDNPMHRICT